MIKRVMLVTGFMLLAGTASAQEITGRWNASVQTAQGPFDLVFELVAEGSELMGSMINDFMGALPLTDGVIDGTMLSFNMMFEAAPGAAMAIKFSGEIDGDELTLTSTIEGDVPPGTEAEQTFVAVRAEQP